MSSTFYVLCTSHDPALEIEGFSSGWLDAALAVVNEPTHSNLVASHATCDLLIGRVSGNWVEFTCPPNRRVGDGCDQVHLYPLTVRIEWLELLHRTRQYLAGQPVEVEADAPREAASFFDEGCWKPSRLNRLMRLLDGERSR